MISDSPINVLVIVGNLNMCHSSGSRHIHSIDLWRRDVLITAQAGIGLCARIAELLLHIQKRLLNQLAEVHLIDYQFADASEIAYQSHQNDPPAVPRVGAFGSFARLITSFWSLK